MAENDCKLLSASAEKDGGRFWKKADVRGPDECWLWKASTTRNGYGQFGLGPRGQHRMISAHRFAYFLGHGVDPGALFVLHRCDEKRCQNPSHLFLGSQRENIRDAVAKGRMPSGEDHYLRRRPETKRRGEQLVYAKLKEADVIEIRRLYAAGGTSHSILARKFGVHKETIGHIIRRKNWTHIVP